MTIEKVEELIAFQKEKLLQCAQTFIAHLTPDDLLQPNDYPELENNPDFRYEEGILAGMLMACATLRLSSSIS